LHLGKDAVEGIRGAHDHHAGTTCNTANPNDPSVVERHAKFRRGMGETEGGSSHVEEYSLKRRGDRERQNRAATMPTRRGRGARG